MYRLFLIIFLIGTQGCLLAKKTSLFSCEPISTQTEEFIRGIQKELGMNSCKITIKNLRQENAMVITIPFSGRYIMALNEKWFNTFSEEARRFIIGHEFMHIKYKHVGKKVALSFVWPSLDSIFMPKLYKLFRYSNVPKHLFLLWYSRKNEKEADLACAKKLHCANGGIEFFESLNQRQVKGPSPVAILCDHPLDNARLKYLQELAESDDYKNSLCS